MDLEIHQGKIHGIQGPNGSGKSVIFKLICGFLTPDSGEVLVHDSLKRPGDTFPTGFGVIIDRPGFLGGSTGLDNLLELAKIQGRVGRDEVVAAMERVGLQPGARQKVRNYSLGMKQKLALAQAFMEGQQALLLDEPFNALDRSSVEIVRQLLMELRAEGRTIVLTSHNQADIDALCDHVWLLDDHALEPVR
ncbi:MAG: ABC transporter ATP-binding protein [Janibacter sp.]|nr:ABC transporter ATP-binding protein [Janibacter sp.]